MTDDRKGLLQRFQKMQKWALASESAKCISAMMEMARSEPPIPICQYRLDADPWALCCENGTLDLRTGELRAHRREDLITKLCPTRYDPEAGCPTWERSLHAIFNGKAHIVDYFRRLCGYTLTGDVRHQMLPVCWGSGNNGKSLIFSVVSDIMGPDYAAPGARELLSSSEDSHSTFKADLFGFRLVTLSETREGGRINETLIKDLTGGEKVKARRMREDNWTFMPTHKFWLATNHKPEVKGTDHGIWKRLRLLPFEVKFWDEDKGETGLPEHKADSGLKDKLLAESEGILAWMVRGCLEWQADGLREPKDVQVATSKYRDEEDTIGRFIRDRCELGPNLHALSSALYAEFQRWWKASGETDKVPSQKLFGGKLGERDGISKSKSNLAGYHGIDLATPFQDGGQEG